MKKFLKDILCDKKDGQTTYSIGRMMVVAMFATCMYYWLGLRIDIYPNIYLLFSTLLGYVLATKGVTTWGQTKKEDAKEEVSYD
jgi:hypothetical protein